MSGSDSVSIGDVEDRKLKSKIEEEPALDVADSKPSLSLRLGSNPKTGESWKSLKSSFNDQEGQQNHQQQPAGDVEDRKLKRKIELEEPALYVAEPSLSLRLGRNPTRGESSSKSLKIYEESGSNSPKSSELWNDQINGDFACKYCTRTFNSSQALGGHQNAHRHERVLQKLGKYTNKNRYHHQFGTSHLTPYPYSTMANNRPYHGHGSSLLLKYPLARMPSSWPLPLHAPAGYSNQGLHLSNTSFTGHRFGLANNHPLVGSGSVSNHHHPKLPLQGEGVGLLHALNRFPILANREANQTSASGSRAGVGVGVGEQSPIMVPIPDDESSESEEEEELDLTLRL